MHAKRNTPEGDRLDDLLVALVEAWEAKNYPLDLPDPIAAIKYHMEQRGLSPHDLIPFMRGSQSCLRGACPQAPADVEDDLASARGAWNPGKVTDQERAETSGLTG